ncbi:MAG TPA: POTRA domain-containing protein, partial [Opitutus sp.]|nr:POTRA domain-containing protein [Opitutus sp.]
MFPLNPNQRPNFLPPSGATAPTILLLLLLTVVAKAADAPATLFVHEYRVEGAHHLPRLAIEEAVYPFLGPGRTQDDVERARAALEQAYRDAGYQTVAVQIPPQHVAADGVVRLQVVEGTVTRLRVKGARYFRPGQIKAAAPSLA